MEWKLSCSLRNLSPKSALFCLFFLLLLSFLSLTPPHPQPQTSSLSTTVTIIPPLSLSVLLLPCVISFFLIPIPFITTLSHSHLSHLHVVTLNSILTLFAVALFCSISRQWRPFSLGLITVCPLFPLCTLSPCSPYLQSLISSSCSPLVLSIHLSALCPFLVRVVGWVMLKMFASVLGSIQVNLNHLSALHKVSQEVQVSINTHMHMHMP